MQPHDEVMKHRKAHLEYQIKLERDGIMYGAGPATRPGELNGVRPDHHPGQGRGRGAADRRRRSDAFLGARQYELYSWSLNEGRINVTLNFSDQTFKFD